MPNKGEKEVSETGNWNVAKEYSHSKIMGPLYVCDIYLDIAVFGSSDFITELENYIGSIPLEVVRMKGFERLVHNLIKVIDNSYFAIKNKTDKETLDKYRKTLENVDKIKSKIFSYKKSERTHIKVLKIDEAKYKKVLDQIIKIKRDINIPLNNNHLIFTDKEEFDPGEYKKKVLKDFVTKG